MELQTVQPDKPEIVGSNPIQATSDCIEHLLALHVCVHVCTLFCIACLCMSNRTRDLKHTCTCTMIRGRSKAPPQGTYLMYHSEDLEVAQ